MIYIVMGVSGSGKSTIGQLLADALSIPFYDADDFHPSENVLKMSSGQALDDDDRWPWLDSMAANFDKWDKNGAVLACSALKESYRKRLSRLNHDIQWIMLDGSFDVIFNRMKQREGHYMKSQMLRSQFDTLEVPQYGIRVSIDQSAQSILNEILNHLRQ